jgi:hypothetical protein
MRWLHNPDPVGLFGTGGASFCTQYFPCACYCAPKLEKLMIFGE